MLSLEAFNRLDAPACSLHLHACCGSPPWVEAMVAARPFASFDDLIAHAYASWWQLTSDAWLAAFYHHPPIGVRPTELAAQHQGTAQLAMSEQQGMAHASREQRDAFARANAAYLQRFGFVFLICATGKNAATMLAALTSRLSNSRDEEIFTAAEEQAKITELRLGKLLDPSR